jgi:hypothetical protein
MRFPWLFAVVLLCASARAEEIKETVHLVITGGPNAGTYDAKTSQGGCSHMANMWGNQLSSPKGEPKKFNSLQLIIPDMNSAADEFLLTVSFGPLLQQTASYEVDTRGKNKSGSGKVIVKDAGKTAKVTFSVKTAGGVKLEGTIDCKSVFVMDAKGNVK